MTRLGNQAASLIDSAGAAGRVGLTIGAVIFSLLGVGLVGTGVYITGKTDPELVKLTARITKVIHCDTEKDNKHVCEAYIDYPGLQLLNGEDGYVYFFSRQVQVGDKVQMEHPPGHPRDIRECCRMKNVYTGLIVVAGGVLCLLIAAYNAWARNNKALATFGGVGMGMRVVDSFTR